MTIWGWKTRYREIRNVFGYRRYDDLVSAKKLNSKIGRKYPISEIKKTIKGQTVFIVGAGPSLSRSISTLKKYPNVTKIVADGAVKALLEHNIKPQILVTDLDGDITSIKKIGKTKIPIIIHAHGNNYDKLDIVSKLQNMQTVNKIRKTLSKRYETRKGGYTRIIKAGYRYGDNAPMAIIEFVDRDLVAKRVDRKKIKTEDKNKENTPAQKTA